MKRGTKAALSGVLGLAALALCAAPGFGQTAPPASSNSDANAASGSNSTSGANSDQRQGQSVTYVQTTPGTQIIKNVPNVYGPGLTAAGSEVCLGSVSAGGAGAGFGVTIGGTIVDQECQLRMNARTLATLGYAVAAREEMCIDPQVRAAMAQAGTPCAQDQTVAAKLQATAEYNAPALAAVELSSIPATATRGCHKQFQLVGGWYEVCPSTRQAANAPTDALAGQTVAQALLDSQDLAPPATSSCSKKYQLIGGWYDECK
jgi:alkylhydroperoxidase/carboxymuconolactone decarboxylase family protein YurZ